MKSRHVFWEKYLRYLVLYTFFLLFLSIVSFAQQQTIDVTDTLGLTIPLRDGQTISGRVYLGDTSARPIILTRGAGNSWPEWTNWFSDRWLAMGYHCVATDYRVSKSYLNDKNDGYDVVEWVAKQSWCNGQVIMGGKSKWGITAVRAAQVNPPHLVAIIPQVYGLTGIKPWDEYELGRGKPISTWQQYLNYQITDSKEASSLQPEDRKSPPESKVKVTMDNTPWELQVWNDSVVKAEFQNIDVPMFNYGGWYDRYPDRQTHHYMAAKMYSKSPNVRLVIDVTDHLGRVMGNRDFTSKVPFDLQLEVHKWLQPILKGDLNQTGPAISMFAMGINEWRTYDRWPPLDRQPTRFYFSSQTGARRGSLTTTPPGAEQPTHYTYDPNNPCPTLGCSNSEWRENPLVPIGPYDQRSLDSRDDVLVFRTPQFTQAVNVTGPIMVKLYASTDVKCTQWVIQLMDEYPDGTCYNLIEGNTIATTQTIGNIYEYNIDVKSTSNVFLPGHRIRVHVTSSLFPLWERNLNTCTRKASASAIKVAHQKIYHDKDHPSYILLPLMSESPTTVSIPSISLATGTVR